MNPDPCWATVRRERIDWLRVLVGAYLDEHDFDADDDPTATYEMLRECRDLAAELEAELPAREPQPVVNPTGDDHIPF